MDEFEVEEVDCGDPVVDGGIQLDVGIFEHATNKLGIHLNNEMRYANNVEVESAKGTEQPIKLELGLRVSTLMLIPGEGPETCGPLLPIQAFLREDPSNAMPG